MSTTLDRMVGLPLLAQIGLAALAIPLLALAPPASGALLLVPLTASARARMLGLAIAGGARLIGPGPGSAYVVQGERRRLFGRLAEQGVLIVRAPAAACGTRALS